jgi:hypothetical protein
MQNANLQRYGAPLWKDLVKGKNTVPREKKRRAPNIV